MAIQTARQLIGRVFFQRCFYLFTLLLAFDAATPFIETAPFAHLEITLLDTLVVVAAVAAVGRTLLSFVIVSLLALATLWFAWAWLATDNALHLVYAWGFDAALDVAAIFYLLQYVYRPEVMTADKLFGAAAAYLLVGSLFATLYALTNHYYPGSFNGITEEGDLGVPDFLYFSYTTLTSTGYGDIYPKGRQARALCNVEQIVGVLYLAVLIARLAGVYPPMSAQRKAE